MLVLTFDIDEGTVFLGPIPGPQLGSVNAFILFVYSP